MIIYNLETQIQLKLISRKGTAELFSPQYVVCIRTEQCLAA